jgi:hypothetical protein
MEGYLGETVLDVKDTDYASYTTQHWAVHWIELYSGIDGGHHKVWVMDQVSRILAGTPVIISEAKWENGHSELRFRLDEPSQSYINWVAQIRNGEDGPDTYEYDVGIAP